MEMKMMEEIVVNEGPSHNVAFRLNVTTGNEILWALIIERSERD